MELANDLCRRTQECLALFQSTSGHRTLADNDWFEDCAADFAWWAHGLKAQKTGRSSLDYRLRERLDVKRVIAGLLDSLALALKEYLQPDKDQESIRDDLDGEVSESDKSSSKSSWSELSDEVRQPEDKEAIADTPDTENSDPRFYIETNLKLLAKISVAIRRSGQKLRYLKADTYLRDHLDDEEYTLLRNHLLFLILVSSYEQKLLTELGRLAINQEIPKAVEIVIRSWIIDPSRATSTQQRLIEANVIRRNRIAYARRFIGKNVIAKKPQEETATTIAPSRLPGALLGPAREASTFGTDTKEPFPIPSPTQPLPVPPEPTESLIAKTLTATELGSQFILPIIMPLEPKKGALSIVTKITQTGTNQDYPACPAKKGSFQCPYCVQVLSEDYATKSRWRNQHKTERWACDECIFESDHDDEFIFDSQESWANHMRSRHSCSEDRLTLLSSMSKRDLNELVQCPLCKRPCGYSRPDQDDHISEHLHSWALRALPWDLNPDDEASSDSPEMGSEKDLARMSEISEQTEDDVESVTATTSSAIDREVTRWSQDKPIGSSRLDDLVKQLEEVIAKWTAHTWLDTQNEMTLQLLLNVNQVKAQFCRASRAKLEESEFTTQQQHDMEENLCTNIELCIEYMSRVIGELDMGPSQDPEEWPNSMPFPKIKADNIPPTEEEKGEILRNARRHVLHSNNVSMQITWARDVLTWVQICKEDRAREKEYNDNVRSETPDAEHDLVVDALDLITHLADQEHPEALYMRTKWVEFGIFGNRLDKQEAFVGYSRAAALGHGRSEYRCGVIYEQSNDILNAKRHYYRGLALNDSASLYRMGMMSLLGQHGEDKDTINGLKRIMASADSSDEDAPQGSYVYGMLIARELPDISISEVLLPHDPPAAKMYIEKSAYLGFAKAQLKMGQAYELCHLDCNFNPSYSLYYYGLAAKQGIPEAFLGVSRWFLFGYEGAFAKNESLAYKYAQQAAAGGLATGEFAMGYYNEIGIHVEKNWAEARRWYQLSADHGNEDAVRRLESLDKYEEGTQDRKPETSPLSFKFPKVTGGNIPPTDDEKEDVLKRAGDHLSDSDSPAVQLAWACDVLTWAIVAEKARLKMPRSQEASKNEGQLTAKALAIIRLFSLEEHPKALYHQGKLFEYGRFGHPINLDQAMKLYHRSTELGHARSCYHLGRIYHRQPEGFEMARPYYEKAEGMGDPAASYELAFTMIHASHGEEQDYEKGLALLKQSADNADEDAPQGAYAYGMAITGDLADFDMDEYLVTTDETIAFSYIEKSANLGYHKAQFQMGKAYEFGLLNCPKDLAKSFHYYYLAVRRGSVEAAEALSCWFYAGIEGILLSDLELSFKFALWGAVEGKSAAEYVLGCHYEQAEYVGLDLNKAREWYELAMRHTSSYTNSSDIRRRAQERLAYLKPQSQAFGETRSKSVDRSPLKPVSKPKTIIVGIDLGSVFSSVSWADSSNPYEIYSIHDWPHAATISTSNGQVPTQYDLETKVWGSPRLQAARLRKSVNIPPKSCFSALEDFCSSVEPTRTQAAVFLTSYIRSLWSLAVHEIFSKTQLWDLEFILSLAIPVYFSWDVKSRLLRVAYDATVQNDASQVVQINAVGQMQAAVLNSLKAQYRLDLSVRGPSIVMENGEIVVVCDCGGTGARAISYEVHTESPPLVRQLTAWNGERIGTHAVDMEFLNYLLNHSSSNLGTSRSALAELDFFIQTEWEYGLKRTFRGDENHDIVLQLPRKAISTLRRLQPSSNKLLIKPSAVRKCFEKSLMAIEKVIDAQFAALEAIGRKPNSILLVGGLAQSPYIIQRLQQKFDVMFHLPDE
ncbi:chitin synthase activator [Fusarium subglutinans]|uniref:Chitin synthase activator n=1 Tax=Gibberella subglutinans TaxID=42677 RepID=A0A8H5QBI5_GIBSU|nr:chitin synthase activator [Fusarium subglutinans]KAF5612420.1 chitin synthase activator [Fusarium subglutinans]